MATATAGQLDGCNATRVQRRCDDLNAEDASDDDDGNGEKPPGDNDGDADIGSPSTKVNIDPKFWD